MRSAMIGASVLLAIFLAWSSIFGGADFSQKKQIAATSIKAAAPVIRDQTKKAARAGMAMLIPPAEAKPESCAQHHERLAAFCGKNAGCLQNISNQWDLCEATGIWPK